MKMDCHVVSLDQKCMQNSRWKMWWKRTFGRSRRMRVNNIKTDVQGMLIILLGSCGSEYGPIVPSYQQCFQNPRSH